MTVIYNSEEDRREEAIDSLECLGIPVSEENIRMQEHKEHVSAWEDTVALMCAYLRNRTAILFGTRKSGGRREFTVHLINSVQDILGLLPACPYTLAIRESGRRLFIDFSSQGASSKLEFRKLTAEGSGIFWESGADLRMLCEAPYSAPAGFVQSADSMEGDV